MTCAELPFLMQTSVPTIAVTTTCRPCWHIKAAPARQVTMWDGSRGKKVTTVVCVYLACVLWRRSVTNHESIQEPNPKCTQMFRNSMFPLLPLVSAFVRWVGQVWWWQSEFGVSRGYLATVWWWRLAYSIRSTVRPPAAGNTWRGRVAEEHFLEDKDNIQPYIQIAIFKHCLHRCAVKLVSLMIRWP